MTGNELLELEERLDRCAQIAVDANTIENLQH
jgi:hypothetical protein